MSERMVKVRLRRSPIGTSPRQRQTLRVPPRAVVTVQAVDAAGNLGPATLVGPAS